MPGRTTDELLATAQAEGAKRPLIFECVGAPGVVQALAMASPVGTRIVIAGVCMERDYIDPLVLISKEIELRYVLAYSPDEFSTSLRNLADGTTRYSSVISGVVGLAEAQDAFARLQTDKGQIKIMVAPND